MNKPLAAISGQVVGGETAQRRIVVGTLNRTTGALICSATKQWGDPVWRPIQDVRERLPNDDLADAEVLFFEAASLDDLQIAAAARKGATARLVALLPRRRPDLKTAAEKLGFEGCICAPINPEEISELARALLAQDHNSEDAPETSTQEALESSAVDLRALQDLAELGGAEFVHDIIAQFIDDAATLLRILHDAMVQGDVDVFRDQAHALRSCAANVGASGVYSKCLDMRQISKQELAERGQGLMERLRIEVTEAEGALRAYVEAA